MTRLQWYMVGLSFVATCMVASGAVVLSGDSPAYRIISDEHASAISGGETCGIMLTNGCGVVTVNNTCTTVGLLRWCTGRCGYSCASSPAATSGSAFTNKSMSWACPRAYEDACDWSPTIPPIPNCLCWTGGGVFRSCGTHQINGGACAE